MKTIRKHIKDAEPVSNRDRWMVSYADFITLLFGFFVMMYALSSVNEGKYKVLAASIASALAKQKTDTVKEENLKPQKNIVEEKKQPVMEKKPINNNVSDIVIKEMADSVVKAMAPWIEKNLVTVYESPILLQIEINASVLFRSGSARVSREARSILGELANILTPFPNAIHVEGFTDNKPIRTPVFPSNWELSAARAATVVRMFEESGIEPIRMAAVGYGEFKPVADNNTEAGRTRNRRVVLAVLSTNDPRGLIDIVSHKVAPDNLQEDSTIIIESKNDIQNLSLDALQNNQAMDVDDDVEVKENLNPKDEIAEIKESDTLLEPDDEEIPFFLDDE